MTELTFEVIYALVVVVDSLFTVIDPSPLRILTERDYTTQMYGCTGALVSRAE